MFRKTLPQTTPVGMNVWSSTILTENIILHCILTECC